MGGTIDEAGRTEPVPILLLAAAGFMSVGGARVMDPLLAPIAAEFASGVPKVSTAVAAFMLAYGFAQLALGPIVGRFGTVRVLTAALAAYAVLTAACALATNVGSLVALRALAGAATGGLIPTCIAYIGDQVPYEARQVTLSRFLTGTVLAQVLAGTLGGALGQFAGWRMVFVCMALAALVLAGLMLPYINAPPPVVDHARPPARYRTLVVNPAARRLLLATFAEGALMGGAFPFVAPYLHDRLGLSLFQAGLVVSCFGLGAWLYTLRSRKLLAALSEPGQVLTGGLLIAVGLGFGIAGNQWWLFPMVEAALGFGYFMLHTTLQARATELLPHARATAVSAFVFMLFLGQSTGALAVGRTIDRVGYRAAFLADAGLVLVLTPGLFALVRRPAV